MRNATILLDPTAELSASRRARVLPQRPLQEATVALLDIGKMRGDEYIDKLETLLSERAIRTKRFKKATNVKPAAPEILHEIIETCDVVVEALADCGSCTSCAIHDLNALDHSGVTGVLVATDEFEGAAAAQSDSLGFEPEIVWVEHPMQNRTTEELHIFAANTVDDIVRLITPSERARSIDTAE